MGLSSGDLDVLMQLRRDGHVPTPGSVIEVGAQQLSNSFFDNGRLRELATLFNVVPTFIPKLGGPAGNGNDLPPDAPLARPFWEAIGFTYASIDIDGSPNSIPLDLNYDAAPKKYHGNFTLVTNYGTTEHVANQLNAFKIIHDLTALGGVMISHVPTQGHPNHGLINYNLKFFWMLARSNQYEWLHLDYVDSGERKGLREDIIDEVKRYSPDFAQRASEITVSDHATVIVLKKVSDIEYVAPIDAPTHMAPPARDRCKVLDGVRK